jgi:ATP phosphoribosyltransferase regulatory subunit
LAGYPICSGGRYDDLIGRFGPAVPATGFAVDVGGLLETLKIQEGEASSPAGPDIILIDFSRRKEPALALARRLRKQGFCVARDIIRRDLGASLGYARETGIRLAVIIGHRKAGAGRAWVIDLVGGEEKIVSQASLSASLRRWEKKYADRGGHRRPMGG